MQEQETDPGFPTGPWNGFYTYAFQPDRFHRMGLDLSFAHGHLRGEGSDDVGEFRMRGSYELDTRRCRWVKGYLGRHQVYYRGVQQGRVIAGEWSLPPTLTGTFSIWPGGEGGLDGEFFVTEEEPLPLEEAEAVATREG